jgi:hypothetical protein
VSKRKGTRNEHKTIERLKEQGFSCIRSAGSFGPFDIVAISPRDIKLVQVKSNEWPPPHEREVMELFKCPRSVEKEVWRWDDYQRHPRIKWLDDNKEWIELGLEACISIKRP